MAEPRPERVLVLAPTGRDAPLIASVLGRAGFTVETCRDVETLCGGCDAGAGALVVAEEALSAHALGCLTEMLGRQPKWSDVPLVILTGGGKATQFSTKVVVALESRANVTLLERPLRMMTLASALHSAIRSRRRQYEVRDLLDETRAAVRQRDQFLAMLGHELRNPLAAIRTAIEVVNRSGWSDGDVGREQADIITRQSANITRLVDDLLDVSRITSGKVALELRRIDLREVARASLRSARVLNGARGRRIELAAPVAPVAVEGDAVRLEQVFTNLLANAIKYTPEGARIDLTVAVQGSWAVARVRDTGSGIPAEILPRIFEPFVQSEQSLARSAGGLGLGLTVVRTLVRMHGGEVSALSEGLGRGSEFTVSLPLATGAPPEPAGRAEGGGGRTELASAVATSRRVLLVEDNADARRAMERLLKVWGHQVDVAGEGADAVAKASSVQPDVMLVDIGLPDIDGYEVARRVRASVGARVRLIALTGYGQPEDRQRARDAGFDQHVVKPVAPDRLQQLLTAP